MAKEGKNKTMDLPTHHRHTKKMSSKQQQQQQRNGTTTRTLSPTKRIISPQSSYNDNTPNTSPHHHATTTIPSSSTSSSSSSSSQYYSSQFLMGLNIAGVASFILQTIYGLFYVDVFLEVYKLPIQSYSQGNMVFAFINTANDLLGAYFLDNYIATHRISRGNMIGIIGVLFSLMFLMPFFRFWIPSIIMGSSGSSTNDYDDSTITGFLHFVISVSSYDTMYSITAILLGSLVTDNHTMTDNERIWFMASGKIVNLIAAFVVARIGLALFDIDYLVPFQLYLIIISCIVATMFIIAQIMARYTILWPTKFNHLHKLRFIDTTIKRKNDDDNETTNKNYNNNNDDDNNISEETIKKKVSRRMKLRPKQVLKDFYNHTNFWAWIGMEVFLECQVSFVYAFLKTFMDRLVYIDDENRNNNNGIIGLKINSRGGYSREVCDWFLSIIRPLGLIMGVLCYIPIRKFGYQKLYPLLFIINGVLSLFVYIFGDYTSTTLILLFLIVYPTITSAVLSSGFHLVMSDMVLEMKKRHTKEGRYDEPSLAGLFMGVNALFCKPAESLLPIVAAHMLGDVKFDDFNFRHHHHNNNNPSSAIEEAELEDVRKVLFQVLVLPPLIFSLFQYLSWNRYTLTPTKTNQMREELTKLHKTRSSSNHQHPQTTTSSPPMSSDHIA